MKKEIVIEKVNWILESVKGCLDVGVIKVVEIEADEGLAKELDVASFVLRNREPLHQDLHRVLKAAPYRGELLNA